jgi:hypothetical protein
MKKTKTKQTPEAGAEVAKGIPPRNYPRPVPKPGTPPKTTPIADPLQPPQNYA